ncbi:hypothetical protein [Homoserinibacter sp. YIM 151385]|uniref:hypothetical protein n=1 Tax=Homoserinibacter sp. YIM 151385 TaxID=2985506 RepID=UPI0022EFE19C|nr:hypothetical protein [Homoserinibacter sp. YIM 151385]WBU38350.1 hypothetical protein OF852_01835 [Homoserinibacter sp. YIM 151385]
MAAEPVAPRRGLARIPWAVRILALVVLAALAAWPLGGWDTVARGERQAPVLEPGEVHESAQFASSVERVELSRLRPGTTLEADSGRAYLAVVVRLENRLEQTQPGRSDLLRLSGVPLEEPARPGSLVLLDDPGAFPELQPGIPARLAYVWEIAEGDAAAGDEVEVAIIDRDRARSQVGAGEIWLNPRVGARVPLEIEATG